MTVDGVNRKVHNTGNNTKYSLNAQTSISDLDVYFYTMCPAFQYTCKDGATYRYVSHSTKIAPTSGSRHVRMTSTVTQVTVQ